MTEDSKKGDLEIDVDDAPQERIRPQTSAMPAAPPTSAVRAFPTTVATLVLPPSDQGGAPGGQGCVFRFPDGVTVEITIPHAIGVSGYGDSEIAVAWWTLMDPAKVILNEGPLLPMLARKNPKAPKQ